MFPLTCALVLSAPRLKILFTEASNPNLVDGIALSRLELYDGAGAPVAVDAIENPRGVYLESEAPENLLDGTTATKWLDTNFTFDDGGTLPRRSELLLTLGAGAPWPASLELYTTKCCSKRDPIGWRVYAETVCGGWQLLDERVDVASPEGRATNYTAVGAGFALPAPTEVDPAACELSRAFRFVFTAVRGRTEDGTPVIADGLQLAEAKLCAAARNSRAQFARAIRPRNSAAQFCRAILRRRSLARRPLRYGADGAPLALVNAHNPYGSNPNPMQPPLAAIDGSLQSKWLDAAFPVTRDASILELVVNASAAVGTYELFTANDVVKRDPVSWSFERRTHAGDWEILAVVSDFDVPLARNASYGTLYALGPPPSPPPPHPPAVPPSPPAPPAAPPYPPLPWTYEFVFSALRPWTPPAAEVQISEVRLFGESGERLDIVEASNPGGYPGPGEAGQDKTAMAAVDGTDTTKWLDINATAMAHRRRLRLRRRRHLDPDLVPPAAHPRPPSDCGTVRARDGERQPRARSHRVVVRDPAQRRRRRRLRAAKHGGGRPTTRTVLVLRSAPRRLAAVAAHRAATSGAAAGAAVAAGAAAPAAGAAARATAAIAAVCGDSALHLHGGARLSHRSDQLGAAVGNSAVRCRWRAARGGVGRQPRRHFAQEWAAGLPAARRPQHHKVGR